MTDERPDERPDAAAYPWHRPFALRWNDNDVFGHVNNTVHYAAMDTTVTSWLLGEGGFDAAAGDMAVVIASSCRYFAQVAFPGTLNVGLRADRVGTTSVSWGLGLFAEHDGGLVATGSFVHVFLDRGTGRPVPVPDDLRARIARDLVR